LTSSLLASATWNDVTAPAEPAADAPFCAGAVLTVDLAAIADNWRQLAGRVAPAGCAAVVKADAYGLGASRVAPALARAGCSTFFVATVDEGLALRRDLAPADASEHAPGPDIFVLNGPPFGDAAVLCSAGLTPLLNSLDDIEVWATLARRMDLTLPAAIHIDTGMARLGLTESDVARLRDDASLLAPLSVDLVMSHLACAEDPNDAMNARQLADLRARAADLPTAPLSLANSSGIFLGHDHHLDLVRPGAALYGVQPQRGPGASSPMRPVVRLQAQILQVREIDTPQTVGYGATHRARGRERIATVGVGYADGFLRSLSNRGFGYVDGIRVPLVGRVSMDLVTFDVSAVPPARARRGSVIDLIGPDNPVDDVAERAGTIGYEILTSLGRRYRRVYSDGGEPRS
jgi:alanine racemase